MHCPEMVVCGLLGVGRRDHRSRGDCERKNPDFHDYLPLVRRAPIAEGLDWPALLYRGCTRRS
jgi:hypothetical protein